MVGFWLGFRIFGIIRFESGLRSVDQGDHSQPHLMLLVDGVKVTKLTREPNSQYSWFTWWSGFELYFRIFGFLKFGTRSRLVDQGDNSQHSSDAFGRPGNSS